MFKSEASSAPESKAMLAEVKPPAENRLAEIRAQEQRARDAAQPNAPIAFAVPGTDSRDNSLSSMRRAEALKALRADMAALAAELAKPAGSAKDSKVHAMRPRLAVVEKPKSAQLSLEGDLF